MTPSLDPRYAIGSCLHGKNAAEDEHEKVAVVDSEQRANALIDERAQARAVTRALRKQRDGRELSASERSALAANQARAR